MTKFEKVVYHKLVYHKLVYHKVVNNYLYILQKHNNLQLLLSAKLMHEFCLRHSVKYSMGVAKTGQFSDRNVREKSFFTKVIALPNARTFWKTLRKADGEQYFWSSTNLLFIGMDEIQSHIFN